MQYTIGENLDNDCLYAHAAGRFWVYDQQVRNWFISDFCQSEYEKARSENSNLLPSDFLSRDDLGYWGLDDYEVPTAALDALKQAIKSKNPEKVPSEIEEEDLPEVCENCPCSTCGNNECTSPCWMNEKEAICRVAGAAGEGCEDYISKEENQCQKEPVPNGDAVATTKNSAAHLKVETSTIQQGAGGLSVPACPADAGAATQSLSAAEPASLVADAVSTFDFSVLGNLASEAHEADEQFDLHYNKAQDEYLAACIYLARIHELTAKAGRYGGGTWTAWYQSKGISEGSARTMVQNGNAFKSATLADLKNLPALAKKDLNLIARQGAATEVLWAAQESNSEHIQEIIAQLKATEQQLAEERQAHQAEQKATSALLAEEQQLRQQANEERIAAQDQAQRHKEMKDAAIETLKGEREAAAQKIKRQAEIIAMREKELAEESDRADAAEQRVAEMTNRPVELAVQVADSEKFESMVNERVAEKTAMYEAQMRFLKEQANDAELRAQSNQNSTYMIAADFAERMAVAVHGIRTTFWNMAKSLSDEDFASALEPLDEAVARIYNREWEDEQYLEDKNDAN